MALPIFGLMGLLWLAYFFYTLSPVLDASLNNHIDMEPVLIQRGDGLKKIAQQLEDLSLIRSASAFKFYSLITGRGHELKPGLYNIRPFSSTKEIITMLVDGPSKEIEVLITEGKSLAEIDAQLSHLGVIQQGSFVSFKITDALREKYPFLVSAQSLEGYLFPDTYRFFFGSTAEQAAMHFLDNFALKISPLLSDGESVNYENIPIVRRGVFSINEITTIASLIEKEVSDPLDRKLVADIIYRRLGIGMALQIDASVDYAKIVNDNRYNTYLFPGLPRGPISNPGILAIEAALNPKQNQYLYYLSALKTKKTIFSKTFEEHKANKLKYL